MGVKLAFALGLALWLSSAATARSDAIPPVGVIDFYGLRHVKEDAARASLGIAIGDSVSQSMVVAATARLSAVPGVEKARLAPVCCDEGRIILYVGIEERGAPILHFRESPSGTIRLPQDVVRAGAAFDAAFDSAMAHGDFAEDDTAGHQLLHYPAARAAQEQFVPLVVRFANELRHVLRHSANADERARAAQILAYAPDKHDVIGDLSYAMSDPAPAVRNNAMRGLWLIGMLAERRPELHLSIPFAPFVDLLNSPVWTDRNKASAALGPLTEARDPEALALLKKRALPALVEMARWKSRGHAVSPCFILGRVGGLSEREIQDAWEHDDRQRLIDAALRSEPGSHMR